MTTIKYILALLLGLLLNLPGNADAHYPWTALECQQYGAFVHAIASSKDAGNDLLKTKDLVVAIVLKNPARFPFLQDQPDRKAILDAVDVVYSLELTADKASEDAVTACMKILVPTKDGV